MGWLRKERDLIGLVAIWTILLQAIVLPFAMGLHAAALTAGPGDAYIICTSRSLAARPTVPGEPRQQKSDCQACHATCRQSCGSSCGGLLPTFARVPLPSGAVFVVTQARHGTSAFKPAPSLASGPRAPPLA